MLQLPNKAQRPGQPNGAFVKAIDASHVSSQIGDVQVEVIFYPADGSSIITTNLPVTVRKPWVVRPGTPQITDPSTLPLGVPLDAHIPYSIRDQLCSSMPSSSLAGLAVTEAFPSGTPCETSSGNGVVSVGGTFADHITLSSGCLTTSYTQTIACDCSTLTQTVSSDAGAQTVTTSQSGGNTCP